MSSGDCNIACHFEGALATEKLVCGGNYRGLPLRFHAFLRDLLLLLRVLRSKKTREQGSGSKKQSIVNGPRQNAHS